MSLIMGFCPKRASRWSLRGGAHPSKVPELPFAPQPWPKPEPFLTWVGKAKPGERFTYFSGFLAATPTAADIAKAAMDLKAAGTVVLFQRRTGPGEFNYIAERRGGQHEL